MRRWLLALIACACLTTVAASQVRAQQYDPAAQVYSSASVSAQATSAPSSGVPCTGVQDGPGGTVIGTPLGCDPRLGTPPPETDPSKNKNGVQQAIDNMRENIAIPCNIHHSSLLADALANLAANIDNILSFDHFALQVGTAEVNVAQVLYFTLFAFALFRFWEEVQKMNTLVEMVRSVFLKLAGIAGIMCFITLAGGTNTYSFTNAAGSRVPLSVGIRNAGVGFFTRTLQPAYNAAIIDKMNELQKNSGIKLKHPITVADNQAPVDNAGMIRFTMCEAMKPLSTATVLGFVIEGGVGSGFFKEVTDAIYKLAWEVIFIILMLPSSAAEIVAGLMWGLHNDMLTVNASLVAVLGIFTLGFLAHDFTKQWGTPYFTLIYNIFVHSFAIMAVGGLVMVMSRSSELMMMQVVANGHADRQSVYELALGTVIFNILAAAFAMFTGKIAASIVNGTLSMTGADVLGAGAAAAGLGFGTAAATMGMFAKALSKFANRNQDKKNSVGGDDKSSSNESAKDSAKEEAQPNNQPQLPKNGESPKPKDADGKNVKEPVAKQEDAAHRDLESPDASADRDGKASDVKGDAARTPLPIATTTGAPEGTTADEPEHSAAAAAAMADVGETAGALAAAADRERDAAVKGAKATGGVNRSGLNKLRQKLSSTRRSASDSGAAALAARAAFAETITKKAEGVVDSLSGSQKAKLGSAMANVANSIGNAAAFGAALDDLNQTVGGFHAEGSAGVQGLASAAQTASEMVGGGNSIGAPEPEAGGAGNGEAVVEGVAGSMDAVAGSMQGDGRAPQAVGMAARVLGAGVRTTKRAGRAATVAAKAVSGAGAAVLSGDKGLLAVTSAGAAASLRFVAASLGTSSTMGAMHMDAAQQLETVAQGALDHAAPVAPPASTIQQNSVGTTAGASVLSGAPDGQQISAQAAHAWRAEGAHASMEQPGVYPSGYNHLAQSLSSTYSAIGSLGSIQHPSVARGLAMLDATAAGVAAGKISVDSAYDMLAQVQSSFAEARVDMAAGGAGAAAAACDRAAGAIQTTPPPERIDIARLNARDLARMAQGENSTTLTMPGPDQGRMQRMYRDLAERAPGAWSSTKQYALGAAKFTGRATLGLMAGAGGMASGLLKHTIQHTHNAASTDHRSADHMRL